MIDGNRLRQLREDKNYSRREVAENVGVTEMQITRYEGERNDATTDVVTRIAQFFGVSTDYLLGLTENPAPNLNKDLSPEEVAAIAAWRRGDYREAIKVIVTDES